MVAQVSNQKHLTSFSQGVIVYDHLRLILESTSLPFNTRIVRNVKCRRQYVWYAVKDLNNCGASVIFGESKQILYYDPWEYSSYYNSQVDWVSLLSIGNLVSSCTFVIFDHHARV